MSVSLRPSQNAEYWTTDFQLTPDDIEFLQEHLLQEERPATDIQLAKALIDFRFRREDQRIRREMARGTPYQPKDNHEIGDILVFPAMDFAVGAVTGKRAGSNPEHGEFDVIQVTFEETGAKKQFVANLSTPHKLNRLNGKDVLDGDGVATPDDLFERFGGNVRDNLAEQLPAVTEPQFINLGRSWLLAGMLADLHVGHLNIAEAIVEVKEGPVSTGDLLMELGVPAEIPAPIAAFSIDLGMSEDERFVDVGVDNRLWYLQRLLPKEATVIPRRLQYQPAAYDRDTISVGLLQLEWELDDEWTEGGASSVSVAQAPSVPISLNYPHRRSGTLPLTNRTSSFFPVQEGKHSMITFIDGRWGDRFPGWVSPEGRYVCGLSEWYDKHNLVVGSRLTLERTADPNEVVIDYSARRMRREWVRMARVHNNQLVFQNQKQAISCEYDEDMVVAEADPVAIDELRRSLYRRNPTVYELLEQVAPNLMGLDTKGTVHAKTLYSAINLVRRTAPGPIFAALSTNPRFQEIDSGRFAMARE